MDLGVREKVVMVAMVLPIIWIGVYPNPLLRRIEPSVIELIRVVEARSGAAKAEVASLAVAIPEFPSLHEEQP